MTSWDLVCEKLEALDWWKIHGSKMEPSGIRINRASEGRPYDPHVARHQSSILSHGRTGHALVDLCASWLRSSGAAGPLV